MLHFQNNNRINQESYDLYNKSIEKDIKYLLIDSRDRDKLYYPNSNNFKIELESPIKNVTKIELISAHIPTTYYNVNEFNSPTNIVNGDFNSPINIVNGDYSNNEFKSAVKTYFNATVVEIDDITNKLKIDNPSVNSPFNVSKDPTHNDFKNYRFSKLLGYSEDQIVNNEIDITQPPNNPINLNETDYILLHLENFERFESKISTNSVAQNAYAKLHLGDGSKNIFFGRIEAYTNALELNPTKAVLNKLDIKFTDYYGNNFNFNGGEVYLTFAITYKKHTNMQNQQILV